MKELRDRPNILYIQSDQHNPAVMGNAGDSVVSTPHLDRLAARGTAFSNAYCASPICVPSRVSMLTGRHPHENRVWTNSHGLDSSIPTFAHALGAAGYRPVQIGRMHFVGPDQLHGFAERYVGDHGPNFVGGKPADHGELGGTAGPDRISLKKSGIGQSAYQVHDEHVAAATVNFIENYAIRKDADSGADPFCVAVGLMLPHQPFVARREDFEQYEGKVPPPRNPRSFSEEKHPYLRWWRDHAGIADVPEDEIMRARTAYWALVTRLDALIGQIMDALEKAGLTDNTMVVYTADHGEQVGERGLWWKQTFYEDSVKVPAIVSWPGVIPAGQRVESVISQLDLNATMLEAGGAEQLPFSHGRSVLPLVDDPENAEWEDIAYSEYCTEPNAPAHSDGDQTWQQRMVRRGEWKLMLFAGMPSMLFNLREDPDELNDLANDPAAAEVLSQLTDLALAGWNPEAIQADIRRKSEEQGVIRDWAKHVQPQDQFRWDLNPDWDYLEN